jgi:SAM-dependent methyltransferase
MPPSSFPARACLKTILTIPVLAFGIGYALRAEEKPPVESEVAKIRGDAEQMQPLVKSGWVKGFLKETIRLPPIQPRKLFHDEAKTRYYTEEEAEKLSEAARFGLVSKEFDEEFYYNTRYGTPLAYARPLDLLGEAGFEPRGKRVLDFGYGGVGQLRLLAGVGANVVGVEVDPLTRALYSWPSDQGTIKGTNGTQGTLHLVHGRFPAEETVRLDVGVGYDLVISKNVLKRGYIHPEKPVPDRQRVLLGVDDETYVKTLFAILKPGGRVLIYNLSPAQNPPDKPYIPWADGRCPFPVTLWKEAGFKVVEFDRDDSKAARKMAHALGWDAGEQPMSLEKDLFAHYTLVEKPKKSS